MPILANWFLIGNYKNMPAETTILRCDVIQVNRQGKLHDTNTDTELSQTFQRHGAMTGFISVFFPNFLITKILGCSGWFHLSD